jgi:translocation and assembly module TamB
MDKQIKYLLGVLILLLISAYFLSLLGGLPQYFKEDIIAFLEERFSGDISFSSVSLWPLNRIRLNDFEFKSKNGTSFKTENLNLDYSLNFNEEEIIQLEFVELIGGDIKIQGDFFDLNQSLSPAALNSEGAADLSQRELLSALNLPDFFAELNVNIRNSNFSIDSAELELELSDLQLGLETTDSEIYTLSISAGVKLEELKLANNQDFNDLNLNKLELKLVKNRAEGSLYFKGEDFKLQNAVRNLRAGSYNYQNFELDLKSLQGLASFRGEINFKDYQLDNYQSQLEVRDLKLQSSYQTAEKEKEIIDFSSPFLKVQLVGPKLRLSLNENRIFIDQNPVDFSFETDQSLNYQLKAEAEDFYFKHQFLAPYLTEGNFDFDLTLSAENNQLQTAAAEISAAELSSEYQDLKSAEISFLLDQEEFFLNRAQFNLADGNQLAFKGSYNFKQKNYLLTAEADDFLLTESLISELTQLEFFAESSYLSNLNKIKDERLNLKIDAAGLFGAEQKLSANGDLNLSFKTAELGSDFKIDSSFWYTNNRLMLNSLSLISDYGRLDLMGEVDLESEELKLRYAAQNLELDILNEFLASQSEFLAELDPSIDYLEGSISESFAQPAVNIRLKMAEASYAEYFIEDIKFSAAYADGDLKINDFQAKIAEASITAAGEIRKLSKLEEAELDLSLSSQDLYFQDLANFSRQELPLSGEVQLQAAISGKLADYNLDFSLEADNSILQFDGQEIEFSKLQTEISREDGDFVINSLTAEQQDLKLSASGRYNLREGFNIDLKLQSFEPASYLNSYPAAADNLSGSLSLNGKLSGELENPVFDFELDSTELNFAELGIEINDNSFSFKINEELILVEKFNFAVDSGRYNLNGRIFDLSSELKTELKLELLEVPSRDLSLKYIDLYPLAADLIFGGTVEFNSQGTAYQALVDISADSSGGPGNLSLSGTVDRNLDLDFEASELQLDFNSKQYDFNLNLTSLLDFSGSIDGSLESPILRLEHQLRELSVNNNQLELVEGEILLEGSRRFSVSENINFRAGGELTADGSYSLIDDQLNLSSNLRDLPLGFLISFLGEEYSASGSINGAFRAEGNLASPVLGGEIDLAAEYLELGLSDPIENLQGRIKLDQESASLDNVNGNFADGSFEVSGGVNFFDLENAWDLALKGQKLYFDYGSLTGDFDADLKFVGPLASPTLEGELVPNDFVIGIPFEFPQNESDSDAFVPQINLDIRPGENVRVENENMEVIVERGNLNLKFNNSSNDPLAMEGRLRSQSGTFTYYNSRFNLQNAEAVFTPVDENDIPSLSVNAITYAGGNEITINLTGPADNMRITLSSDSDLTEDEILNLLSTRGALGSAIIGGEDIGIQNIIWQELIRIVNSFLQRGVISDIESDFKTAFSLDRAEIDVFQYGLEREFALYLGKNITDRLYLEYASFFTEEGREGEISFQYKLTDPTVLKGTYFGDQEYQISIETEIEF